MSPLIDGFGAVHPAASIFKTGMGLELAFKGFCCLLDCQFPVISQLLILSLQHFDLHLFPLIFLHQLLILLQGLVDSGFAFVDILLFLE